MRPPRAVALRGAALDVSWWDRFLIGVAPKWGLERVRSRAALATMSRYYEAASGGRRTDGWDRSGAGADANAAAAPSLVRLRELSRDLRRNNGWARRGIKVIANNTIGWGILPKPVGVSAELAKTSLELWRQWADTAACDFDGRLTFYGLQRLVMDTVVESGEALVLLQPADEQDGLPVPMRVQVLEPDYLDLSCASVAPLGREGAGNRIVHGIEFDSGGRRVAYHLHKSHPGAGGGSLAETHRVPASRVIHVYNVERPQQRRGVPWLCAAIARLNDFDDYSDAVLMQQKIAACFSAFVQDYEGTATALGEVDAEDDELETLEPGHIQYLPPGKSISFATPPSVGDHTTFTATNLRRIAASLGVTYEDLTGDYSQVNFSSARMGRLSHMGNVHDWRWNMIIPQLCDGVWRWAMEMAAGLNQWAAVPRAEWSPPPPPMLDPEKEGKAYQSLVRSGAMTLYGMIRELGEDPATHLEEIAASNKRLDELGIVLDSDPRKASASGGPMPPGAAAPKPEQAAADDEGEDVDLDEDEGDQE